MRPLSLLAIIFISASIQGQKVNIIPQPAQIKTGNGILTIKQPVGFIYNDAVPHDYGVSFFKDYLKKYYKISQFKEGDTHNHGFPTEIFVDYEKGFPQNGGYEIIVDGKGITVRGNEAGLFYAFQTLIQLLPIPIPNSKTQIPFVTIKDAPRFPYRGMHLDVGRHFFPVSFVKKYIDWIALHKMNYFHWHLTEDQGWRIEIKKYPGLTKVGAWRNGTIIGHFPGTGNDGIRYGGYYTQDEIKEVVAYAAKRYITVIPEIEMPGHCSAAITAYPWLSCFPGESTKHPPQCAWSGDTTGKQVQQTWGVFQDVYCAGKDSTFKFLQDVLDEVMSLFPSRYIHVGGDECPKENWKRCPRCQQRIKDEGLKDEHELQSYFIQRMEKYLNSKGRTLIGWDEILEGGLAPNAVVMSWRGEAGGIAAARQKHDVVMTPGAWVYFDHSQTQNEDSVTIGGYTPIEKTYNYEPVSDSLTGEQGKFILGAQGNVWTEYMDNERKVEYMIFPRMAALSEVLWSQKRNRDSANFEKRLLEQFKRYDLWKVNYSQAYWDIKSTVLPTNDHNGIEWKLETKANDKIIKVNSWSGKNKIQINIPKEVKGKQWYELSDAYLKDSLIYTSPLKILAHGFYEAILQEGKSKKTVGYPITQTFFFNKATGKKITLTNEPSQNYPGDGAFTLVNGVQNEKGLLRSREFLGFNGTDCQAIINLDSFQTITSVTIHIFQQKGSRIWPPLSMEAFASDDGQYFSSLGKTDIYNISNGGNGTMTVRGTNTGRFVKVLIKNQGIIPEGNPGAGNKALLLVDEIEVN